MHVGPLENSGRRVVGYFGFLADPQGQLPRLLLRTSPATLCLWFDFLGDRPSTFATHMVER